MNSNSEAAGRRPAPASFRLALLAGVGAAMLLAGGCSRSPVEPVAYENANVDSWFSGSTGGGIWDRYEDDYKETRAAYEAERYSLAVQRYRELARKGVPEAAYELGKAYRYGNGAPKDPALAAQWMMAAVSKSHSRWPHASYHLGTMFLDGEGVPKDPAMARRLLQQALDHGYAAAALPLARIYAEGTGGMPRNVERAEQLALQAAENGDPGAYIWLLRQYSPGGLLGENRQRAALLSQRAMTMLQRRIAETGDPAAMRDLAIIHFEGLGTRKDSTAALNWLQRAAQADHPEYLVEVGEKLLKGKDGYPAEPELGFKLLRTAAVRYRQAEAMALIAEAYGQGLGTPRDPAQEQAWYRRAVEAGSATAALDYGRSLVERRESPERVKYGVQLIEIAARENMPYAWSTLGKLHVDKDFPGANPAEGVRYLQRAHEAGIPSATAKLGQAYLEGTGVRKDPDKAYGLLKTAAEQGQPGAMLALGKGFMEGDGLPRRPDLAKVWLEKAADTGIEHARLEIGRGLLSGEIPGNPFDGARIVESFARKGNTLAMMELGRARRDGTTIPANPVDARRWFEMAMRAGEPGAKAALASMMYMEGNTGAPDVAKLQEAAQLGHAGAMSTLGRAYLTGEGLQQNPHVGENWLRRAIEAGNMGAAQTLGSAYLYGDYGLQRNPAEGRRLLEQGVAAGNASAQRDLGYALIKGEEFGLPPDRARGLNLLSAAASKSDGYSMELLGTIYLRGSKGIKPDPAKAEVWLERAARKGDVSSLTMLGSAHLEGSFPKSDPAKGIEYLERAAERGDDTARTELGNVYMFGADDIEPQPKKGEEYLKAAAANGHAGAKAALGRAYINGTLGEKRTAEGARLLFEAARAGHSSARLMLAEAFLKSRGLEGANRDYAQAWLQTMIGGDSDVALATLTEMLRNKDVNVSEPKEQAAAPQ